MQKISEQNPRAKNTTLESKNKSSGSSSKERAMTFFKELSKDQIKQIYEYYKLDFLAFGYDPKEYLDKHRKKSKSRMRS